MSTEELSKLFGVDFEKLEGPIEEISYPDTVPGRVLHIDGDFIAYQISADEEKTLEDMMHNHDVSVETLRLLAGAEKAVCHLTDKDSCKGKRYDLAIQKEYQCNRKDKEKPEHLYTMKKWMVDSRGAINHTDQEADDGLCQANWEAIQNGTPELSVLVSKDKDLKMCSGYHLHWEMGDLEFVDGFGYIEMDESTSTKKITGKGTAYFWAQMLTGDSADSIAGLPTVPGSVMNKIKPTKPIASAVEVLKTSKDESKREKAKATLAARKAAKCGPVTAFELLKSLKNDKQCFELVKALYRKHGENTGFKHWLTGDDVRWQDVFISEAQLLWMRRHPGESDVFKFFMEKCICKTT